MGSDLMTGREAEVEPRRSNWLPVDAAGFHAIQFAQFRHDEAYHREISRLTVKQRLTHMALHFAKYAGQLAAGLDDAGLRRTVTDLFVIAVSTGNVLNVRLHDLLSARGPVHDTSPPALARNVAVEAGRMAAACEKLDHLEDFAFRREIQAATVALLANAVCAAADRGWDVCDLVQERLGPVKEKSIFHVDLKA